MAHPLTAWRGAQKISKGKLARAVGVSWRTLHRIERGTATPSLEVALALERETHGTITAELLVASREGRSLAEADDADTCVDPKPASAA